MNHTYARVGVCFALCWIESLSASAIQGAAAITQGPVVGAVTSSSAIVWARVEGAASVAFQYGTVADLSGARISDSVPVTAEHDFTVKVELSGLMPSTRYFYRARANGRQMSAATASFLTAPSPDAVHPFRFVYLTDFEVPRLQVWPKTFKSAADFRPELAIIGGDFDHRDPGLHIRDESVLRERFRAMYRENLDPIVPRRSGLLRYIFGTMGMVHLWDDHDYCCNGSDGTFPGKNVSLSVYDEYFPSYPRPTPNLGIAQTFRWGHVQFYLLDGRSFRTPENSPDDEEKTLLGAAQKQWLKDELEKSTATWNILLSGSVFNPTVKCGADNWCEYRTEGKELVDWIAEHDVRNVVVLSGDIHAGAITDGKNSVYNTFWEMAVPGADVVSPGCDTTRFQGPDRFGEWNHGTWGVGFYPKTCWGFGAIEVLTNPHRLILSVRNEDGAVKLRAEVPGVVRER